MENVCNYKGKMTLDDKLQSDNDQIKEENANATNATNYPGFDDNRPIHITQLRLSLSELFISLIARLLLKFLENT